MTDASNDPLRRIAALEREVEHLKRVQACTASLIASLELPQTLDTILKTALEVAGARQGSVLLYGPERTHLRIANAVGLRPETVASTRVPDGEGISGGVARSGEPVLVEDIDEEPRFRERRARDDRSRSFASLPLSYRGRSLGVMNLSHPREDSFFARDFLPMLVALGQQAAVAIAHSEMHESIVEKHRLEQQIEMARSIQESFIPPDLHVVGEGYEFAGRNAAARSVGGDLYDIVETGGGGYAFFLGDVSGKGVPAALYMARLLSDIHHLVGIDPAPERVLASLNKSLCERGRRGMFVTLAYGVTTGEEGLIRLASAGHPPPLLRSAVGPAFALSPPPAPPLGVVPDVAFASLEVDLQEGDLVLFYSDGATEAADGGGEQFGAERLARELRAAGRTCNVVVDHLFRRLKAFSGDPHARDDVTFLAVRRLSRSG